LIGIDWLNAHRFGAEIKIGPQSLVISDPRGGDPPPILTQSGARVVEIPMKEMAKSIPDGRPNMIALGIASRLLGLSIEQASAPIEKRLADKGTAAVVASRAGIKTGFDAAASITFGKQLTSVKASAGRRWLLSGNEATALGAIRGGVRFAAAYPITPATEVLEWLAPNLTKVGGVLLQAEDELAAVNMIIGASFGGTPAVTATSGPGLSLMIEAIGLATSAELPIVVVDVMRGGPSTGIPTKSEQADLNIAVYGLHGDAPHLVLAPQSVGDCVFTTQWATYLAEALQSPAIVLSDQFMGQARAAIPRPADVAFIGARSVATEIAGTYERYALAANGVSPMAIPGTRGGQYTADGLTHSPRGIPTSGAADHLAQLDKRRQA
jgi:2-oxoglutarate ferredoxin oxidoreductase subunit alpha